MHLSKKDSKYTSPIYAKSYMLVANRPHTHKDVNVEATETQGRNPADRHRSRAQECHPHFVT